MESILFQTCQQIINIKLNISFNLNNSMSLIMK